MESIHCSLQDNELVYTQQLFKKEINRSISQLKKYRSPASSLAIRPKLWAKGDAGKQLTSYI